MIYDMMWRSLFVFSEGVCLHDLQLPVYDINNIESSQNLPIFLTNVLSSSSDFFTSLLHQASSSGFIATLLHQPNISVYSHQHLDISSLVLIE
jgi:hypothetical protein